MIPTRDETLVFPRQKTKELTKAGNEVVHDRPDGGLPPPLRREETVDGDGRRDGKDCEGEVVQLREEVVPSDRRLGLLRPVNQ